MQILKTAIKMAKLQGVSERDMIQDYLLMYRVTPHATTGSSPANVTYG